MTANHALAEPRHHDATDETPARTTGRAPALVFCLVAGLVYWTIVARGAVATGELGFADAYMHLVRAAELLASGDWYDHEILRSNAPYGEILHWTRPFDVILLALTALLRPFMAAREALYWAGALIAPLLTIATCLAAAWAIAPLAVRHRHWVMPILFLQWPVLGYGYPGRADHHILILLVFVVGIGLLLRALTRPADRHWPFLAGLSHGFGLWVAAEFLIALAVVGGFLTLRWLLERERGLVHMLGRVNQRFYFGLALMTALGVALEHPLSRLAFPEYDRISVAHFAMALLAAALWSRLGGMTSRRVDCPTRARRLCWLILWGGLAGGLLIGAFPGFLVNPMAPQLAFEGLRGLISEVAPLFPDTPKRTSAFLITLSGLLFAVPVLLWQLARHRASQLASLWWLIAGLGLVYLPLALWQMRFSLFLSLPLAILLAALVGGSFGSLGPWTARPARALLCAILLALPLALQQAHLRLFLGGQAEAIRSKPGCEIAAIAPFLNGAALEVAGERIIVSPLGYATALLYFTRHAVVGSAYHRNVEGTRDSYDLLESVDQTAALALVKRRGIDLLLLCARAPDPSFRPTIEGRATLYRRLLEARPPGWLRPVALPESLGQAFKLYSVVVPDAGAPLR